jgi:hypothetical protein
VHVHIVHITQYLLNSYVYTCSEIRAMCACVSSLVRFEYVQCERSYCVDLFITHGVRSASTAKRMAVLYNLQYCDMLPYAIA